MSAGTGKLDVLVTDIKPINTLVKRFQFERADGRPLPNFSGGAHVVVEMKDDDRMRLNPYSLMSSPLDTSHYAISVRRDDQGRGGSLFMHNQVAVGDRLVISYPVNLFALDLRASKHLMLAGGIGITPFMAQMAQLAANGSNFELHYSCRSRSLASYAQEISAHYDHRIHLYYDDEGQQIDISTLLSGQALGTQVYVCGPRGMIDAVCSQATAAGWPDQAIHFEEFITPPTGKPFKVRLARSDKTITVGEHQSLLEAIEAAGIDAPYLCRGGACGQCETDVLSCDGSMLHNDHWLTEDQHASEKKIMPCVSRFEGELLELDR